MSLDQMRNLLAPADSLAKKPETPKEYFGKSSAALEQLAAGVEVIHPTFGKGVVEEVKGSGSSATVAVRFEGFDESKKLVYRFAKLVLA
jgi:UDP-N-acetylglucosamine:LPS N-acetylglucosamine transferase